MAEIRTGLLWIHVLSGAVWIGTCAITTIAANVLPSNTPEFRDFAVRAVPARNRVNLSAAIGLLLTGISNFFLASRLGADLSPAFLTILAIKILLYLGMAIVLIAMFRSEKPLLSATTTEAAGWGSNKMIRVGILSAITAMLGAVALTLGLWLVG